MLPAPPPPSPRLDDAVATLAPFERTVLRMSVQEQLSTPAIADRLGVSRRRVERALARALVHIDRFRGEDS